MSRLIGVILATALLLPGPATAAAPAQAARAAFFMVATWSRWGRAFHTPARPSPRARASSSSTRTWTCTLTGIAKYLDQPATLSTNLIDRACNTYFVEL